MGGLSPGPLQPLGALDHDIELLNDITWQAKLRSEYLITGYNNQIKIVLICHV